MRVICLILLLLTVGCTDTGSWKFHKDGSYGPWWFHRNVSPPAYPDYIADEPCLWLEGGELWFFDRNGAYQLSPVEQNLSRPKIFLNKRSTP